LSLFPDDFCVVKKQPVWGMAVRGEEDEVGERMTVKFGEDDGGVGAERLAAGRV